MVVIPWSNLIRDRRNKTRQNKKYPQYKEGVLFLQAIGKRLNSSFTEGK